MPFCPCCHYEYRLGFTRCSDCDIELVNSLSEENCREPERSELELVELASFPDPMQAQMIQELLKANGIESMFQSDLGTGAEAFTARPNALMVRKVDFPKWREIYEYYFEGDPSEQEIDDEDEVGSNSKTLFGEA
jgi:hypothetical protein